MNTALSARVSFTVAVKKFIVSHITPKTRMSRMGNRTADSTIMLPRQLLKILISHKGGGFQPAEYIIDELSDLGFKNQAQCNGNGNEQTDLHQFHAFLRPEFCFDPNEQTVHTFLLFYISIKAGAMAITHGGAYGNRLRSDDSGFTGDYVSSDVVGESKCKLQFRFPRSMTNNYEVLNGSGHVEIHNGQLMRMKGFRGLLKAMPSIAPAISWFTDSTQASSDYVIENGVVKTDNTYIEGSTFSIKMYGQMDTTTGQLDYTVRVQFTKKDSIAGMILHPLTWPFTKLLLEFKLAGTAEDPQWEYISVLDRVVDAVK